ncbi:MAG: hypothetical protein M0Z89_04060 [Nitrospiraceae bacterium]|nr:hypothetical protein [Nitrospiraceae bacterium]
MYGHSENTLKRHLEERLGRPLVLVLTENASTMLSVRLHDGVPRIRLHRMFLNAGNEVLDEITSYIKKSKASMPLFRSFVRENREGLVIKPPKKVPLKTAGAYHDLRELHDAVNKEYFNGTIDAAITWGSRSPRSSVRRRTLGSYSERSHIIRINPVLDRKAVPRYFVAFIVYHEMLHAFLGAQLAGTRRSVHSREFRKREKLFKEYEKAMAWERGRA